MTAKIHNPLNYHRDTLIASLIASVAAVTSATMGVAPWVMFVGWVASYTKPVTARQIAATACCCVLGLLLGCVAVIAVTRLFPSLGVASFAVVVMPVALLVVSLRSIPIVNNTLAWFLGLITTFAAHPDMTPSVLSGYALVLCLGVCAGFCNVQLQQTLRRATH